MKEWRISDWVDELQRYGRYGFTAAELAGALEVSLEARRKALARLQKRNRVRRLRKEFYVILPVEYAKTGMIPVDWFLEDLLRHLDQAYYVGLLTAAGLHGAAHQQSQEYHVIVGDYEPAVKAPGVTIRFFHKTHMNATPLVSLKGHSGMLPVSTPEATAFDLVRYANRVGGLDAVLTILEELCEVMSTDDLARCARAERVLAVGQRLGWLLDRMGHGDLADALHREMMAGNAKPDRAYLDPAGARRGISANRWKVVENSRPESDL
jgi:predicted transcriptional regulator of viral defense system